MEKEYTFTRADVDSYVRAAKSEITERFNLEYNDLNSSIDGVMPCTYFSRKCFEQIKRVTGVPSKRYTDEMPHDEIVYGGVRFCAFVPKKEVN